jgi:hypothetical protein
MSKAATTVTKTADNAISFLRFMTLSFRDLSFGRDTMDGAPDGHTTKFLQGVIRLLQHGPAWQETESAFLLRLQRGTYSRIMRDRRIRMACRESRGPQNLVSGALDWACGGDSTVTNPDKDQNHFAASYYLSERDRSTEMIRARKQIH